MVKSCSAHNCRMRDTPGTRKCGITFHSFPRKELIRKEWILAVRRENWQPSNYSHLCSNHFTEDQFDRSHARVKLKRGAVPEVFERYSYSVNTEKLSKHRTQKEKDNDVSFEDSIFSELLDTPSDCNSASSEESSIQPCNTLSDKLNAEQLQSSDEDQQLQSSDEDQQLQSSDEDQQLQSSDEDQQLQYSDEDQQLQSSDEDQHLQSSDEDQQLQSSDEDQQLQSSDKDQQLKSSDEDQQLQSSDEESESEKDINNFNDTNVITLCDPSEQSSSPCNPSPFVTKVVNILNSSPSPVAAVKPPSCAESLQLIQNIFSRSCIKEDQSKDLIKRDICRSSALIDTYCRKIKLMQKMIAIQEKKVEALKRVTSSIKRERIIE